MYNLRDYIGSELIFEKIIESNSFQILSNYIVEQSLTTKIQRIKRLYYLTVIGTMRCRHHQSALKRQIQRFQIKTHYINSWLSFIFIVIMRGNHRVEDVNSLIVDFKKIDDSKKSRLCQIIKDRIQRERNTFSAQIKFFNEHSTHQTSVIGSNLILGATGSGKSTLFNYLQSIPLVIQEGTDAKGKKNGVALIQIQDSYLGYQGNIYSPIGSGFQSWTVTPFISRGQKKDYINVDCPGEFDNKDFLQSIVNSYLRIDVCALAPKLKLTIVTNFHELMSNRATAFKKTLAEIQKVFGCWDRISVNSVCLVVTHVPVEYNDQNSWMKNKLQEILKAESSDLKKFAPILQNIIQKGLFCVMPAPKLKLKPQRNNRSEERQLYIPEGQPYSPNKQYFSLQIITNLIDKIGYTQIYKGLLCPGIKEESILIINQICQSLIKQIKQSMMLASKRSIQYFTKPQLLECADKIKFANKIQIISEIFQMSQELQPKFIDLQYFIRLSSFASFQEQVMKISKDILICIKEAISSMDKKQIQEKRMEQQMRQQEFKRKENLNNLFKSLLQIQKKIEQRSEQKKRLEEQIQEQEEKKQRKRLKQLKTKCKENLKDLQGGWTKTKDSIQNLQTLEQKRSRTLEVQMQGEIFYQNVHNLRQIELKNRIKQLIAEKRKWVKSKKHQTTNAVYLLSIKRRLKKIRQRIEIYKAKLREKLVKKYQSLQVNQNEIYSTLQLIEQCEQQLQNTRKKQNKLLLQRKIEDSQQRLQDLEEKWEALKDDISEYQGDSDKEDRDECVPFDKDLSRYTEDSQLDIKKLNKKIERMSQNMTKWQEKLEKKKYDHIEQMEIKRRINNLEARIDSCRQIQAQKLQESDDSD